MKVLSYSKVHIKDIALWVAIILGLILVSLGMYSVKFSGPVKAIIWIVWFLYTLGLGWFTSQGKTTFVFIKQANLELQKVVWPTRQETVQTTMIVMVMVSVTGFILWGVDSLMIWVIAKLTQLG